MIINIFSLLIIFIVAFTLKDINITSEFNNATYALGFLMITGYLFGRISKRLKMPSITGNIIAGILIGPYVLKLITLKNVNDLQLLNGLALSIIALTAGGEINYKKLKQNLKSISSILFFQTIIILFGFIVSFLILYKLNIITIFNSTSLILASAILIGIISTASSPSTTLAVIVESKIKNRFTQLLLSIVMLKDIVILFLFVIGLSIAESIISMVKFEPGNIFSVFLEISGSLTAGLVIGTIIVLYLRFINKDNIVFILAMSFFSYEIFEPLHLHPLLIMMIAGFIVENFSKEGGKLIIALESVSPPVYVIFFTLTGASINILYLKELWLITLIVVVLRMIFKFSGTYIGSKIAGEDNLTKRMSWMGYISQAGLSLGMAKIIESTFPNIGTKLSVILISIIIINQIIGPLMLKYLLDKSNSKSN